MDLQKIKEELLFTKAEIEARLVQTSNYLYKKIVPARSNLHEQLLETTNDALVLKLEKECRAELRLINNALKRLAEGKYQYCSRCGGLIDEARIAAVPYTELCIKCPDRRQ
jgi:DnaK suppressor protein